MKNLSIILLVAIALLSSCKKDNENACDGAECNYTLSSGETAGSAPSNIHGTHSLSVSYEGAGSPYTMGTNGTFTVEGNKLTVEIEGLDCITLINPYQSSASEVTFVDNCRDNLKYSVSESSSGSLNEVNVSSLSGTFYCQFN